MDSKDSCGYVENWDISTRDELIITNLTEIPDKIFAIISHIEFEIDNNEYTEYLRKRISELDILANIFSLVLIFLLELNLFLDFILNISIILK